MNKDDQTIQSQIKGSIDSGSDDDLGKIIQ